MSGADAANDLDHGLCNNSLSSVWTSSSTHPRMVSMQVFLSPPPATFQGTPHDSLTKAKGS